MIRVEKHPILSTTDRRQQADHIAIMQGGACFYVCGDAKRMAKDVDTALREIMVQEGKMSEEHLSGLDLQKAMELFEETTIPRADRALATRLVQETLRRRGELDFRLARMMERDPIHVIPEVTALLLHQRPNLPVLILGAGGVAEQNWLILRNGEHVIGLFQGMFEKNTLTFNPGWDQDATELDEFTDVRELQRRLKEQGIDVTMREVLDVAAKRIEGRFEDQPLVEAEIRTTLGATYRSKAVRNFSLSRVEASSNAA